MKRFDTLWLEDRRQWLQQLEPLLAREPGWQEEIRSAYRMRNEKRAAQYQEVVEYNTELIAQVLAEVLNSRTATQRENTRQELEDLRNTMQKLIDAPDVPSVELPAE